MSRIYIEPSNARRAVLSEDTLVSCLRGLSRDVDGIRDSLNYRIAGKEAISARLREVSEQIVREAEGVSSAKNSLEQIISRYEQAEKNCIGIAIPVKNAGYSSQSSTSSGVPSGTEMPNNSASDSGSESVWSKLLDKVLDKVLGPAAFFVKDFPEYFEGKENALAKLVNAGVGAINDVLGADGETTVEWLKDLFDIKAMEYTSFKDTFFKKIGNFETPKKAVGTVVGWATKLIDSFIENKEEFGTSNWSGRFWSETLLETGVKIGEGAAVGAGVSAVAAAICAAAGVTCPAIVVGAAAAAVTVALDWGLDSLVSWVTNGSQTSWIEGLSDLVCDTGEKIIKNVGPVVTKVKDKTVEAFDKGVKAVQKAGEKVVNTVSEGFNKLKDGVGEIFSSCRWGIPCLIGD